MEGRYGLLTVLLPRIKKCKSCRHLIVFIAAMLINSAAALAGTIGDNLSPESQKTLEAQYVAQRIYEGKLYLKELELEQRRIELERELMSARIHAFRKEQEIRGGILARQLVYHPIVLSVVIIIVLAGVAFSGLQAVRDYKSGAGASNSLEIGPGGLKISSTVVGLITLTVSFAFFYQYVIGIYRIVQIDLSNSAAPVASNQTSKQNASQSDSSPPKSGENSASTPSPANQTPPPPKIGA